MCLCVCIVLRLRSSCCVLPSVVRACPLTLLFCALPALSLQQQQADGYGGPPPSPVVAGSWGDRAGYVDDGGYMRQDPNILPGAGTPIASTASANGEAAGFMVSTGG